MFIDPQAVVGALVIALAGLITAVGFYVRERAVTRTYVEKARADDGTKKEEAQAHRDNTLAEIAKQGVNNQQLMIDALNQNTRAFTEMTKTANENTAETRGMISVLNNVISATRSATITVEEQTAHITAVGVDVKEIKDVTETLQTDIEGSITHQFGPVVAELKGIGTLLTTIASNIDAKDGTMNDRLTALIELIKGVELRLLTVLEPIVLKHLAELMPNEGNHKEKDNS
jgi:hypothetical protein